LHALPSRLIQSLKDVPIAIREHIKDNAFFMIVGPKTSSARLRIAAKQSGIYRMIFPNNRREDIARLRKSHATRWFCEVRLKSPKGFPSEHFKLDSWFFPVDFVVRQTGIGPMTDLGRRGGENGEVPDWKWLNTSLNGDRYPHPSTVTEID